jgi:hypothetical protein
MLKCSLDLESYMDADLVERCINSLQTLLAQTSPEDSYWIGIAITICKEYKQMLQNLPYEPPIDTDFMPPRKPDVS